MLQKRVNLSELNILYVRDLDSPLKNQDIDFYIQEEVDGTYEIYQLPSNYWGYNSDFHNRFAYSFNNLSFENQHMFRNKCRHMVQNVDGSYYEDCKKYIYKDNKTEF